jgi:4-hydroxy-tetrahydrodipicolinate synthase
MASGDLIEKDGGAVVLSISGMTCGGCASSVTRVLSKVPSVVSAEVDLGSGRSTVLGTASQIAPLHAAMFVESNPISVKWALAQLGKLSPHYRLPLTPLSPDRHEEVASALRLALGDDASHLSHRVGDQA